MISKGELNRLGWFHIDDIKEKINKKIKENIDNNIVNFETLTKEEILELLK